MGFDVVTAALLEEVHVRVLRQSLSFLEMRPAGSGNQDVL